MLKYTDRIPLRRSTAIPATARGGYVDAYPLPVVYGRVTLAPRRYDTSGYVWLIADHPIQAVDRVLIDGRATQGYAWRNDQDATGHPVAILETATQVEDGTHLSVSVRGRMHPTTGALLEAPHQILWDLLANICGMDVAESDLDALRGTAATAGLVLGGVVENDSLSIQRTVDAICAGGGLAWSPAARGLALLWPSNPSDDVRAALTRASCPRLTAAARANTLATRVIVEYAYDWARGDHRAAVALDVPSALGLYGLVERTVSAGWLRDARAAEAYGRRLLERDARTVWEVEGDWDGGVLCPGDTVAIDHPHSPVPSAVIIDTRLVGMRQRIVAIAAGGSVPRVRLVGHTSGDAQDPMTGPLYEYLGGLLTVQVLLPDTLTPAVGARVQIDGAAWLVADSQGYIQWAAETGEHRLHVIPSDGGPAFDLSFTAA